MLTRQGDAAAAETYLLTRSTPKMGTSATLAPCHNPHHDTTTKPCTTSVEHTHRPVIPPQAQVEGDWRGGGGGAGLPVVCSPQGVHGVERGVHVHDTRKHDRQQQHGSHGLHASNVLDVDLSTKEADTTVDDDHVGTTGHDGHVPSTIPIVHVRGQQLVIDCIA
jgi:hypothetical protein